MAGFTQWIKQAVSQVIDPDKSQRIDRLVKKLEYELGKQRQAFSLKTAMSGIDYKPSELQEATETFYHTMIGRGWQDGLLSDGERTFGQWVAQRLELSPEIEKKVNLEYAKQYFAMTLAKAMEDGFLDDLEEQSLAKVTASVQMGVPEFAKNFFLRESEGLLRGIFAACVAQNRLAQDDWIRLVETAKKLGVPQDEMLRSIQTQAKQFVEHVLADAKSDQTLSSQEEATLNWLLENFQLDSSFRKYVSSEISRLKLKTEVLGGRLPTLTAPTNVAVRAGEIVHLHEPAVWRKTRVLKSGTKSEDHQGTLTLTDNRVVFSAPTRSETWNLRKVTAHSGGGDWIELQIQGQAASLFFFPNHDELYYMIFGSAVAMSNQTLVRKIDAIPTRHISREIRQRVWQRYAGKCAECGAQTYLEFDHIVPVAKGGSNSENNVQLLCRNCNLKKSDHI